MNNPTTIELIEAIKNDIDVVRTCPSLSKVASEHLALASVYLSKSLYQLKELERKENENNKCKTRNLKKN